MPKPKAPAKRKSVKRRSAPPQLIPGELPHGADDLTVLDSDEVLSRQMVAAMTAAKISRRQIVEVLARFQALRVEVAPAGHLLDTRTHTAETLQLRDSTHEHHREAERHYEEGIAHEESNVGAARSSYLAALKAHSGHLEARINLGRLLHLGGELQMAEKVYRQAKHASAGISFNLAILMEDMDREVEAIDAYRDALALDPSMYDAHFNLSRLYERADKPREAMRHLLAYRRQTRPETG